MPTIVMYADDYMKGPKGADLTYANSREQNQLGAVNKPVTFLQSGQYFEGGFIYNVYESFLSFAISLLGNAIITAAELQVFVIAAFDDNSVSYSIEARKWAWNPAFGSDIPSVDYIPGSQIAGLPFLAFLPYADIAAGGIGQYFSFTNVDLLSILSGMDDIEFGLVTDQQKNNLPPTVAEEHQYILFSSQDEAGTAQDPRLILTIQDSPDLTGAAGTFNKMQNVRSLTSP